MIRRLRFWLYKRLSRPGPDPEPDPCPGCGRDLIGRECREVDEFLVCSDCAAAAIALKLGGRAVRRRLGL